MRNGFPGRNSSPLHCSFPSHSSSGCWHWRRDVWCLLVYNSLSGRVSVSGLEEMSGLCTINQPDAGGRLALDRELFGAVRVNSAVSSSHGHETCTAFYWAKKGGSLAICIWLISFNPSNAECWLYFLQLRELMANLFSPCCSYILANVLFCPSFSGNNSTI